jgi:hypothetical protein
MALLGWLQPPVGAVWGVTIGMSWSLLHYAYIASYFRKEAAAAA